MSLTAIDWATAILAYEEKVTGTSDRLIAFMSAAQPIREQLALDLKATNDRSWAARNNSYNWSLSKDDYYADPARFGLFVVAESGGHLQVQKSSLRHKGKAVSLLCHRIELG